MDHGIPRHDKMGGGVTGIAGGIGGHGVECMGHPIGHRGGVVPRGSRHVCVTQQGFTVIHRDGGALFGGGAGEA